MIDYAGLAALIAALSSVLYTWRRGREDDRFKKDREDHDRRLRTELIILGQSIADLRNDSASLALLVNQLFNQFQDATGRKPDIDFEMLHNLRTLQYKTGKLGPLDLSAYKEPKEQ